MHKKLFRLKNYSEIALVNNLFHKRIERNTILQSLNSYVKHFISHEKALRFIVFNFFDFRFGASANSDRTGTGNYDSAKSCRNRSCKSIATQIA